jgi:hypothetical protein
MLFLVPSSLKISKLSNTGQKLRRDHETKNTSKFFWISGAVAHTSKCNAAMCGNSGGQHINSLGGVSNVTGKKCWDFYGPARQSANQAISSGGSNNDNGNNDNDSWESKSSKDSSSGGGKQLDVNTGNNNGGNSKRRAGSLMILESLLFFTCWSSIVTPMSIYLSSTSTTLLNDLFRVVRRKMKYNMTQSGTHDSYPWHFMENALLGTPGFLLKISGYYVLLLSMM